MSAAGAALLLGQAPALADHTSNWSIEELNIIVDQTNFVVGRGCSGTLISAYKRLILTANHCVEGHIRIVTRDKIQPDGTVEEVREERRDKVKVEQRDYKDYEQVGSISYQTEIVAHKKERDLALLQLVGDNLRSTFHAQVLPPDIKMWRGDQVIAVGNMRGLDSSVTSGVISSTNRTFKVPWANREEVPLIQYDAAGAPGSSGGAVYDSQGHLIGVTISGIPGEFVLAIPAQEIQAFLDENCFGSVYDPEADDEKCREEKENEGDGDGEPDTADGDSVVGEATP